VNQGRRDRVAKRGDQRVDPVAEAPRERLRAEVRRGQAGQRSELELELTEPGNRLLPGRTPGTDITQSRAGIEREHPAPLGCNDDGHEPGHVLCDRVRQGRLKRDRRAELFEPEIAVRRRNA
jgi:hypothetical protein